MPITYWSEPSVASGKTAQPRQRGSWGRRPEEEQPPSSRRLAKEVLRQPLASGRLLTCIAKAGPSAQVHQNSRHRRGLPTSVAATNKSVAWVHLIPGEATKPGNSMFATLAMPSRRQPQPAGRYLWFRLRLIPTQPGQAMAAPLSQGKKMVNTGASRPLCTPSFPKRFWQPIFLLSIFQFRGQQLEQALVDIILLPYILICLAEQLRVGAGHRHVSSHGHIWNLCTMFTAYPFAAFQKLYYLNSCTTKNAQQINTYVTVMHMNPWGSVSSKNINSCSTKRCAMIRMNHQERTIKNVITAPHPPATTSETATNNKQRSNMYCMSIQ